MLLAYFLTFQFFPNLLTSSISNAVDSSEEDREILERDTGYVHHSTGSANKFLGVTATTSQDIQLGLTFTVPFLSIPLNSINSLIGGNFADIGNFLNFGNLGSEVLYLLLNITP